MHKVIRTTLFLTSLLPCFVASHLWSALPDPNYPLVSARLVLQTLSYIQRYYVEPSRINPNAMFEGSLNQIQKTLPEILVRCEKFLFCSVRAHQASKRFRYPGRELAQLGLRLKEVFQFMDLHVDKDTDKKEIEFAALDGLLNELDPHSNFMSPEAYREFRVGTEGEFGGLGIVIGLKDGRLTVTAPLEGTPAWQAGIKAGDHIFQINEESTINMTLTEAVARLRGPVGTKVSLKIERTGQAQPMSLTLKRAVINIEAVQSKIVKTPQGNPVGFIRVKNFQANTEQDFHEQLEQLTQAENNLKGIVLDLRNNPGGLMDQALTMADEFLKEGVIVSTVGPQGKLIDRKKAREDGFEIQKPVIVLVNEGSASASEIVAGALKNNNRTIVMGNKTFGKGSVQSVYELPLEAALKLTVAQYLTPGNQSIQTVGITPDIELFPIIVDKNYLDTIENILMTEKDLEKHFDQLQIKAEIPTYKLKILTKAPEEEQETTYRPGLSLEEDRVADIALTLMDSITSFHRITMLEEIKNAIQEKQAEEEKRVMTSFQKLGADWDVAEKATKNPQAELSFHILKDGKPIKKAPAGEEVTLQIGLKNVGEAPFYRLVAQSESETFLFKNIEFAFGKVMPGLKKTWETKLKIPPSAFTEEVPLKLKFKEYHQQTPPDVNIIIPIQGLKRPRFAHQYSFEEKFSQGFPKGKPIELVVKVVNQGEGPSKIPVVAIKNLGKKEIFIEKGRSILEALEAGKSATTKLKFHLDPNWNGDSFRLELSITDSDLLVGTKQELTFQAKGALVNPPQDVLYSPPSILLAGLKENTSESPYLFQGEVKDDQVIRDISIFVGEEKVFYETNMQGGPLLHFQVSLPLKKGNNVVMITARDQFNLVSREFRVIQFNPPSLEEVSASKED